MFAFDSNAIVHFFKGVGAVREHALRTPVREVSVPSVVVYELLAGAAKYGRAQQRVALLEDFFRTVRILPFDTEAAHAAARVQALLSSRGEAIGPLDTLIAGTVLAARSTLVTHNTREFARVPGLKLADWY